MNTIPDKWKDYVADKEYLMLLLNPEFIEIKDLIIIRAHYSPETFLKNWETIIENNMGKLSQIENTINHVHLSSFIGDLKFQEEIGSYLSNIWRKKLASQFPDKKFEINLSFLKEEWELGLWVKRGG